MKFKAPAIPLITVDPFFSIWSGTDSLVQESTKHWSDRPCPILAAVEVDGGLHFAAGASCDMTRFKRRMAQTSCEITPLSTKYTFENSLAELTLTFTTPLLLDEPDILARPVSYVHYEVRRKCDEDKRVKFVFGINARACVDNRHQMVEFKKTNCSVCCGNVAQNPLAQTGDRIMIDWGYMHIADRNAKVLVLENSSGFAEYKPLNNVYNAYSDMPYLVSVNSELSGVITVGYDEINPIEYFGTPLTEYNTAVNGMSFLETLEKAAKEYDVIKEKCDAFDQKLLKDTEPFGEAYQFIASLSYRQAIAGHKLVADEKGDLIFLSKECDSNGCIGTLDVTYPSIPLFLKYNPEFVLGMLRPIIRFAKTDKWKFKFAPHDVGQYPVANGQWYGNNQEKYQMPVEESGNILLCLAAVYKYSGGNKTLFDENIDLRGRSHFALLFAAISNKQVLSITYKNFKRNIEQKFIVHPYYLKQFNGRWFLVGYSSNIEKFSLLAFDRIVSIDNEHVEYIHNGEYDFNEYFDDMIGVTKPDGASVEKVKIWISAQRWPYIETKPLHGSQKIVSQDKNGVTIQIEVYINRELEQLILSFGKDIKVLEPIGLRNSIISHIEGCVQNYK